MANAPIAARTAFGPDLSTVEPCSIVDVNKLANLSAALMPADAFDDCPVSVTQQDGTKATVSVGPLETKADNTLTRLTLVGELPKGMRLYRDMLMTGSFCYEYVTFADELRLMVSASTTDVTSTANVCPSAVALARNAADAILAGSIRHVTYPADSIGSIDPCQLVPDAALVIAGQSGVSPTPYPQRHECAWLGPNRATTAASLRVIFSIGPPPQVSDKTTDTMSSIAGRTSLTSKITLSSTSTLCYVETGLRKYGTGNLVETATVDVHSGSSSTVDPCNASTIVATAVWQKLPRTG